MYKEFLQNECISLITRISCLLVYYNFQLSPLHNSIFQNNKVLFRIGNLEDIAIAYLKLFELEQTLLNDIWIFCSPQAAEPEPYPIDIWAFD